MCVHTCVRTDYTPTRACAEWEKNKAKKLIESAARDEKREKEQHPEEEQEEQEERGRRETRRRREREREREREQNRTRTRTNYHDQRIMTEAKQHKHIMTTTKKMPKEGKHIRSEQEHLKT